MVAAAHGLQSRPADACAALFAVAEGRDAGRLVRMAESLQLHARALRAEIDDLAQLQLPCILHWDMNHFVVLVGVRRGIATIHDPAHGLRRLKLEQVSRHFTGVALELTPAAGFEPRVEKQHVSRVPSCWAASPG
jgi:ATP-binding cassette subfamily B protein RaxB